MKIFKLVVSLLGGFTVFCAVLSVPPTLIVAIIYLIIGAPFNIFVTYAYWFIVIAVVNGAVLYTRTKKRIDKLDKED